ncbi:hypothetical protein ISS30_10400 [bacterium]|nr:hypothetical protein [FCB group bacterium]MBL7192093.1 hypothetical protein [bacterium]
MRCHCGSNRFIPLGVQNDEITAEEGGKRKNLYLINCIECGTTISCSKTFYAVVEYLSDHNPEVEEINQLANLAH